MTAPTHPLDPRLAANSHVLTELPLCQARLQDDARFPWIVLVPRRRGAVEIADLDGPDQAQLWRETLRAGAAVRAVARALHRPMAKLNHGQLGNLVAQLHIHVVARTPGDAAWPGPVWGAGTAERYTPEALAVAMTAARQALQASV